MFYFSLQSCVLLLLFHCCALYCAPSRAFSMNFWIKSALFRVLPRYPCSHAFLHSACRLRFWRPCIHSPQLTNHVIKYDVTMGEELSHAPGRTTYEVLATSLYKMEPQTRGHSFLGLVIQRKTWENCQLLDVVVLRVLRRQSSAYYRRHPTN